MVGMSWVLSMALVEGLSAEQIAGRLEAELGEETASDSPVAKRPVPVPGCRRSVSMVTAGRSSSTIGMPMCRS
jgi:hypothetical protein